MVQNLRAYNQLFANYACMHACMQSFWPPEMLAGRGQYGKPLDVWQLGCMFFTCVAFYYPFGDDTRPNFRQLVNSGAFNENDIPAAFPQLRELVRGCLAVDAAQRPTIEQVLAHPFFA